MPNILETLTFSDASKRTEVTDIKSNLRRKMVAALDHQANLASAELKGETYTVEIEKWVETDKETRAKARVRVQKIIRPMWYRNGADAILLELRFANKPVTINGKPSIVVGTIEKLVPTIQTIRKAVLAGELDTALKAAADSRKRAFKKAAPTKPTK
ncbi:MAG: hypothetical protein WCO00_04015 [Rhodospirillaceae bacterium]